MRINNRGPLPGGDLEHALLVALWELKDHKCTARQLHDIVGKRRGIVYTTVTKVLDRMVTKGLAARSKAGKAYVYHALVSKRETQRSLVRDVLANIMGKDPRPAVAALLGAIEDISSDLLDELAAELKRRKDPNDGA